VFVLHGFKVENISVNLKMDEKTSIIEKFEINKQLGIQQKIGTRYGTRCFKAIVDICEYYYLKYNVIYDHEMC